MLVKIFSTATLIVLAWLSVQMLHSKQAMDVAQANFQHALADVRAEISRVSTELNSVSTENDSVSSEIFARMDQFSAEQQKFKSSAGKVDPKALKAKNEKIIHLREAAELQSAYATVLKADLAAQEKQGVQAAKLLTSTKTAIWKTSDKWERNKEALRKLMAPIDILAGKWNRGDYSSNSKSIQKALLEVLESQPQP